MALPYSNLPKQQYPNQWLQDHGRYVDYRRPVIEWGNRVRDDGTRYWGGNDYYYAVDLAATTKYRNALEAEAKANPIKGGSSRHAAYLPGGSSSKPSAANSQKYDDYYKLSIIPAAEFQEMARYSGYIDRQRTVDYIKSRGREGGLSYIGDRVGFDKGVMTPTGRVDTNVNNYMTGRANSLYNLEDRPYADVKQEFFDGLSVDKWRDVVKSAMFKGTSAVDESLAGISQGVFNSVDQVKPRLPRGVSERQLQGRNRSGRSR